MDVTQFLKRFHFSEDITDVFSNGCCYWFAKILYDRFALTHGATIMYDEVINHFGTKINGRVYDTTGDVTFKYEWRRGLKLTMSYFEHASFMTASCSKEVAYVLH